ncbi:MAG TPA: sulfite exporter TauE/SafE family protein [Candidatus Acidoferrales bacterium]|nr:sulfite exporter TauE/SafE family protein [Candidatus Acidoferrales bacterium]
MASYLLLLCAALLGGVLNSVAGGGMFVIFPALVFTGVPSIIANASSTLAVIPGILASAWAYRHDFRASEGFPFGSMVIVSVVGGIAGALLLLFTPQKTFDFVIPWLLLLATLLFIFGLRIAPGLKRIFHIGPATVVIIQFFIAVYGGYFGGAIGIMMLATWTVFGLTNIHMMNANRTLLGAAANIVATALFIAAHKIWWPQTLVMLVGTVIGGYAGAHWARKANPRVLRACITVISVGITIAFFLRRH